MFRWVYLPNNHTLTVFLLPTETAVTSGRGAGGLCSSTLEKLKGFTCSADASDAQTEKKKTDGGSSKICYGASDVQHSNKNRLQRTEEEHEDEEDEVKEKEGSGLAATKQVPDLNVHFTVIRVCFVQHVGLRMKV